MEVFEAVRKVLALREYQDKPVPPGTVRRIVEAGRLTGSSMNRQPWHFIVVQNRDTLRQLGTLAKTGPYIAQAALAAVRTAVSTTRLILRSTSDATAVGCSGRKRASARLSETMLSKLPFHVES